MSDDIAVFETDGHVVVIGLEDNTLPSAVTAFAPSCISLDLSNNPITSLRSTALFAARLETLACDHSQIGDLSSLPLFPSLQSLSLRYDPNRLDNYPCGSSRSSLRCQL